MAHPQLRFPAQSCSCQGQQSSTPVCTSPEQYSVAFCLIADGHCACTIPDFKPYARTQRTAGLVSNGVHGRCNRMMIITPRNKQCMRHGNQRHMCACLGCGRRQCEAALLMWPQSGYLSGDRDSGNAPPPPLQEATHGIWPASTLAAGFQARGCRQHAQGQLC